MLSNVKYDECLNEMLRLTKPTIIVDCHINEALNNIIAEDIVAIEDVPSFDKSPYDGYVFNYEDSKNASLENPVRLKIIDEVPAGTVSDKIIKNGECIKILTGAKVPQGGNIICMFEETEYDNEYIKIFRPYEKGKNIIYSGEDIKKGTTLIEKGTIINSATIGCLCSLNKTTIKIYKPITVGIFSTGSELLEVGNEKVDGKIYNSNKWTIEGILKNRNINVKYYGIAKDSVEGIKSLFEKALNECDAIITTGGVSVGDYDLTPVAIEKIGAEIIVRGVGLKPGMACCFAVKNNKPIMALSGNPMSSLTTFYLIAMPIINKIRGIRNYNNELIDVYLYNDINKKRKMDGHVIYKGKLIYENGKVYVNVSSKQGNIMLHSLINCDFLVISDARQELNKDVIVKGIKL